jgi:spore coat polysaccharide biosynthesis protein SpsF
MKTLAITQARIGSTRFPEKILKTINGESLLEIHLKRIKKSKLIAQLKVATTNEPDSDKIVSIAGKLGIKSYKGSVENVLERFYKAAVTEQPDWVVRLTSDCPLIDPAEIDRVIQYAYDTDLDYVSNALKPTYPDGINVEIFKFSVLEKTMHEATLKSELEHVTPYIWKNSTFKNGKLFTSGCVMNEEDLSLFRLTVDRHEDFEVIKRLIQLIGTDRPWIDYVNALEAHPEIKKLNMAYARNEGYEKSLRKDDQSL